MTRDEFFDVYGHLRPGTYDILSPRYDQVENFFKDKKYVTSLTSERDPINAFSKQSLDNITCALENLDWDDLSAEELLNYCAEAIKAREYSKFIFTRAVSDILELIANQAASVGVPREVISFLRIDEIVSRDQNLSAEAAYWKSRYHGRAIEHQLNMAIRLPMILHDTDGVYVIPFQISQPNFVTNNRIQGDIVLLTNERVETDISGKIVLIENADPGFDWIFAHDISGLITKYGGVNSHMAIRCTEFDIPAAIGCGEQCYETLIQSRGVEIDCERGLIRPIDGALSW